MDDYNQPGNQPSTSWVSALLMGFVALIIAILLGYMVYVMIGQ